MKRRKEDTGCNWNADDVLAEGEEQILPDVPPCGKNAEVDTIETVDSGPMFPPDTVVLRIIPDLRLIQGVTTS